MQIGQQCLCYLLLYNIIKTKKIVDMSLMLVLTEISLPALLFKCTIPQISNLKELMMTKVQ